jgi:hypothetical protein
MVLSLFFEGVRVICWVWWIIVYIALLSVGVLVAVSIFWRSLEIELVAGFGVVWRMYV